MKGQSYGFVDICASNQSFLVEGGGGWARFVLSVFFWLFRYRCLMFVQQRTDSQSSGHPFLTGRSPLSRGTKEEGLAGDVPIREMLDSNAYSLSTQRVSNLTTIKSEVENDELQVAREFLIRARTERVCRTLVPPILVLTFIRADLNEMGHCRTPTLHRPTPPSPSPKESSQLLYIMRGQIHRSIKNCRQPRLVHLVIKACPKKLLSGPSPAFFRYSKKACPVNPNNELPWVESVGVEGLQEENHQEYKQKLWDP